MRFFIVVLIAFGFTWSCCAGTETSNFDATLQSQMVEFSDGSRHRSTTEEFAETNTVECGTVSFREDYFYNRCETAIEFPSGSAPDRGVERVEASSVMMGTVDGDRFSGWFHTMSRNHHLSFFTRDNGETLRSYTAGRVSGTIKANGRISLVIENDVYQIFERKSEMRDEYLFLLEGWEALDMNQEHRPLRTREEFAVATASDGGLVLPRVDTRFIARQLSKGFTFPREFRKLGVTAPPY